MIGLLASLGMAVQVASPAVTLHGMGDLRVGMTVPQLRRIGGVQTEEPHDGIDCSYWRIAGRDGLAVMVSGRRVVRIDVDSPTYRTRSGAGIGMSEAQVRKIYGRAIRVEPHPYTGPDGHYLIYRARREPLGLIFETSAETGAVESFRAGLWDHVQLIEGCS